MIERKETLKYSFVVEGFCEKWYLEWLQDKINASEQAAYHVRLLANVQRPLGYAKRIDRKTTPALFLLSDIEGERPEDQIKVKNLLKELKTVKQEKGIPCNWGYSNLTFELWMILHKKDCNNILSQKGQYLQHINQAFGRNFDSLAQYKENKTFHACLAQCSLEDVKHAVARAKQLMNNKKAAQAKKVNHHGYAYYVDNPALSVGDIVEKILKDCKLL